MAVANSWSENLRYFPIFLDLDGKTVFVAGGGPAAANKLRLFAKTNARLICVSRQIGSEIEELVRAAQVTHRAEDPREAAFGDALIVIAATESDEDEAIAARASAAGLLVNAVDKTSLCTFITPSIVDRGKVIVAIGTEGAAPVLARRLRERIEGLLHENLGALADFIGRNRARAAGILGETPARRSFWESAVDGELGQLVLNGHESAAEKLIDEALEEAGSVPADPIRVSIAVSPMLPDDLTIRTVRALQDADVLVFSSSVPSAIIDRARRDAVRVEHLSDASALASLNRDPASGKSGTLRIVVLLEPGAQLSAVETLIADVTTVFPDTRPSLLMPVRGSEP